MQLLWEMDFLAVGGMKNEINVKLDKSVCHSFCITYWES